MIEALDRCIQVRFRDLKEFGLGRIPVVPQHVYQFQPQTQEEKELILWKNLERLLGI